MFLARIFVPIASPNMFSKWAKMLCSISMWRQKNRLTHMTSPQHQLLSTHLSVTAAASSLQTGAKPAKPPDKDPHCAKTSCSLVTRFDLDLGRSLMVPVNEAAWYFEGQCANYTKHKQMVLWSKKSIASGEVFIICGNAKVQFIDSFFF